jgi:hypothetical protein
MNTITEKLQDLLDRIIARPPAPHEVEAWSLLYTETYLLKLRSMR